MPAFKPLNVKKYQKVEKVVTPDTVYWKKLSSPTLIKEFGAIDYIDFSPTEPYCFAVTCSVRVQIYNPITKLVVKNLSKFQEPAYGGTFRQDGRLLVAGDEQSSVKLFDTQSKNILRLFKGHKAAVHRTFFTADSMKIASFSDDKTVRLWDIANEKSIHTFGGHEDYIRAGAVNPVATDTIVSGGYDGKILFHDTRTNETSLTLDHGCPVESLLFLPTGGVLISSGGTEVRVWDAFAGGRLLTKLSQHHKTITCLHLASNGRRLMSGSLDRHVKIYDVATYQTVHTLDFPGSILSLGVAGNDSSVVAGMVDGLVSVQNMVEPKNKEDIVTRKRPEVRKMVEVDQEIVKKQFERLEKYDKCLKNYQYSKFLDEVMKVHITNKTPEVTVAAFQELIHRKGLHRALAGRTNKSLLYIISFIRRHIGEHRFMRVLIDVGMTLLDVYEESLNELGNTLFNEFNWLASVVQKEVDLSYDLLELQGSLELIMDAARAADKTKDTFEFVPQIEENLKQSKKAKASSVVKV